MKWTVSDLIRAERITEPLSEMVCTPRGDYVYWTDLGCDWGNDFCFVFDCTEEKWDGISMADIDSYIYESVYDFNGNDDWKNTINHYDELCKFIQNWNMKQSVYTYIVDINRVIVMDESEFNELIGVKNGNNQN